jgi:beta-catenin-like protein 1
MANDADSFLPCDAFQGPRDGYFFSTRNGRTGYYRDRSTGTPSKSQKRPRDSLELLEQLEQQQDPALATTMDERALKRLITSLTKKYRRNVEDRIKYAGNPEKFYGSEVELAMALDGLKAATASPLLYPLIIDEDNENGRDELLEMFMSLVQHENGDIAAGMVALLSDLTDVDDMDGEGDDEETLKKVEEQKSALVQLLIRAGLIRVLVQSLTSSLDESKSDEEANAVYNALSIIENVFELRGAELLTGEDMEGKRAFEEDLVRILEWLCQRMSKTEEAVSSNAQYASEILAVILQSAGEAVRVRFVEELSGVDVALRCVAPYRSKATETPEEQEFLENMFDVLCAVLMEDVGKASFLKNEGIELMILFLKGRTMARTAALKCLDFATTQFREASAACVEKGLLPLLFGIFMKKLKVVVGDTKKIKRHVEASKEEEQARCVSIISNLFVGLSTVSDGSESRIDGHQSSCDRLVAKFLEKDCEKCKRLVEILVVFAGRVASEEERILSVFDGDDREEAKDEVLLAKMDAGLFTLEQCAMILAELWASGNNVLRRSILQILHENELTLKFLDMTLTEYVENLGDKKSDKIAQHVARVQHCITLLRNDK